jgi:hypothetical protein
MQQRLPHRNNARLPNTLLPLSTLPSPLTHVLLFHPPSSHPTPANASSFLLKKLTLTSILNLLIAPLLSTQKVKPIV